MAECFAIVVAAGAGRRLGVGVPKALVRLGHASGSELVALSVRRLLDCGVQRVVVTVPPGGEESFRRVKMDFSRVHLVDGGETRSQSVRNGLEYLRRSNLVPRPEDTVVAIHDAARPFFGTVEFQQVRKRAEEMGAAILAAPMIDAVCVVSDHGLVQGYESRDRIKAVQTPQVFRYDLILRAYASTLEDQSSAVDDASLVIRFHEVDVIESSAENFKVTTPGDLDRARKVFAALYPAA